jgi:GMP synthase (glutamine-hydrolysing)
VWDLGVPVLGICYGMFTMAVQQGGQVEASAHREFGYAEVRAHGHTKLLQGIQDFATPEGHGMLKVWMSHGDKVTALPPGFKLMASTPSCPIAGMADEARGYYAVQFHPEVTHTVQGAALLERFVLRHLRRRGDWIMRDYIAEAVALHPRAGGHEEVILGLSGGVDSSVAAALIHRAIGDQLTCVFVDHGLLRLNEGDDGDGHVRRQAARQGGARRRQRPVPGPLAGVTDPEAKRKIIGREFVEVFQRRGQEAGQCGALAGAGHDLPRRDRKSGGAKTKKATTIKSHHNVGGLPETPGPEAAGAAARPVQGRGARAGRGAGPAARHGLPPPVPRAGPGRAHPGRGQAGVRRPAAPRRRHLHRRAARHIDPASGKSWYDLTSQAFAVFLPVKSVGVMGDGRTYDYVVALRAVQTSDFMTADWAELPYALLKKVSSRIINEVRGINRVTYDVSSKPPATIEWE